ncbi:hypothetical protein BX285_2135 [Streptomyces sp. 1114.5]|uniref:hypothetical protein n=1 Tax=Streptomyces sp. 1114.5 TaxID=1938830 RepID=UPI000EAB8A15|nr:hypothetical protein [Streptomyces sp. 1114.5]RKT17745.1 hypothetical protein BX285_2135 [Streptomyces sp. 1114.5]
MDRLLRNTLAIVVTAGALGIAAAPVATAADQAQPMAGVQAAAGVQAQVRNPKTVKADAYNQARSILANAGSQTAAKSHPIHGKNDVPVSYGTGLLASARDEFRAADKNLPAGQKKSDMSIPHYNAIHNAAKVMGIDRW